MKKLIIDRSKWRTGDEGIFRTGKGDTYLCNSQGFMCCLGFEAIRLGYTKEEILDIGDPYDIDDPRDFHTHSFISDAIDINDDKEKPLDQKERELISLFATVDVELEFINEPTYDNG